MDHSFLIAQVTGAIPGANPTAVNIVKLTKPDTNQAVSIPLDGTVQIDLSAIVDTPLPNITVELTADRSVSGTEFASLFPITSDPSVLPTAGNPTPASSADFQTVTIDQLINTATALALLGQDSPNGTGAGPNGNPNTTLNLTVQGP